MAEAYQFGNIWFGVTEFQNPMKKECHYGPFFYQSTWSHRDVVNVYQIKNIVSIYRSRISCKVLLHRVT